MYYIMGNMISHLFEKKMNFIMIGLDNAGKSTIAYKLAPDEVCTTVPKCGHAVETFKYKNILFDSWDLFGADEQTPILRHFSRKKQGLIFVVDSIDRERIGEAEAELMRTLLYLDNTLPVLIFANKQDSPDAMNVTEITDKLCLQTVRYRKWVVQAISASKGEGVDEGLEWLIKQVRRTKIEVNHGMCDGHKLQYVEEYQGEGLVGESSFVDFMWKKINAALIVS